MNKKWTLHVENFAKIKSADVTIAPLMCFMGDFNIRKRYFSQEAFRSQSI